MGMYLGLDVSTSCTGVALVDSSGKLVRASYVYLGEHSTIHGKAEAIKKELQTYATNPLTCVAIEQNLLGFRRGASSAATLITLARFNGVVAYVASQVFGVDPVTIPVVTARKDLLIPHKKGEDVKKNVFEWVLKQEPEYTWPTKTVKLGKRKGEVIYEKGVEDACDAYVMARAAILMKIVSDRL